MSFASAVDVHPGIVVGMLQHARITPFRNLSGFKVKFQWSDGDTRLAHLADGDLFLC
jgi:HTH-type transcriptional regulator / antitoxin HigA